MRKGLLLVLCCLSALISPADGEGQADLPFELGFELKLGKRNSTKDFVIVDPAKMASFRRERVPGDARRERLVWTGSADLGAAFTVVADLERQGDGAFGYDFRYEGNASDWDVEEIRFPVVTARRSADAGVLVPRQNGLVLRPDWAALAPDTRVHQVGPYPIGFRFLALLNGGELPSVYVDQRGESRFHASRYDTRTAAEPGKAVLKLIYEMPVTDETRRAFRLPFGGVLRTFEGGWFEAMAIYRDWVRQQDWYRRVAARDFAKLRDVALWMWNRGPSSVTVPPAVRFMQETGLKVALDWYWWHGVPYDTNYPFFWPPREPVESFRAGVEAVRAAGGYVQPYTNGMLWDMDADRWHEGGSEGVIVRRNGTPIATMFNPYTRQRQAWMCGEAAKFHGRMRTLEKTIRTEGGTDGVYMDMIANAAYGSCFNPSHRHPRGGGRHMVDNYRAYVEQVRADNPGFYLSSEEQGEPYLDLFESFIFVYPSYERFTGRTWPRYEMVPVFQAVYHGCIAMFGSYATIGNVTPWDPKWGESPAAANMTDPYAGENLEDEKERPDQFAVEFSRGVVWGMQPTVHKFLLAHATEPRFAADYAFVKDTARFYRANLDLLFDGEMRSPGKMTCALEPVDFLKRGCYTNPKDVTVVRSEGLPAVFHSVWRSRDGRRTAAVLVNWTRRPQAFELDTPDVKARGEIPPRSWKLL